MGNKYKLGITVGWLVFWGLSISFLIPVNAQSMLVKKIKEGENQTLVVYGTSLTMSKGGNTWLNMVVDSLNNKYGNRLKAINAAKGGACSFWGIQNLEENVIKHKPDAVMVEFGINDAYSAKGVSLDMARLNLNYMVDRIKLYNPNCEIILQIMNMPIGKPADNRPELKRYYDLYRTTAKERNLLLIDHYPNWENLLLEGEEAFLEYVPDGIHPNPEGAIQVTAPYIITRLEQETQRN